MFFYLDILTASTYYKFCGRISFMSIVAMSLLRNDITKVSSFDEMLMHAT
jgi:hypothetical protein